MPNKNLGIDKPDDKDVIAFVISNKQKYKWIKNNFKKSTITKELVSLIEREIDEWFKEAQSVEKSAN